MLIDSLNIFEHPCHGKKTTLHGAGGGGAGWSAEQGSPEFWAWWEGLDSLALVLLG